MIITKVRPCDDFTIEIETCDGVVGIFDLKPYLEYEVFSPLRQPDQLKQIFNGGYFIEWSCGADLSADTIEAKMLVTGKSKTVKMTTVKSATPSEQKEQPAHKHRIYKSSRTAKSEITSTP